MDRINWIHKSSNAAGTSRTALWNPAKALCFFLLGVSVARAEDLNPFDALRAGRVRAGISGSLESLRVVAPGRGSAQLEAGGSYSLEGLPVGVPIRVFAVPSSGASGPGGSRLPAASDPQVLDSGNGFAAVADVSLPRAQAVPVFLLSASGPGGTRTIDLPAIGQTAQVTVLGETATGESFGSLLGPLESPAVRIESSNPAVVAVTSSGQVASQGLGRAWVRVSGDGEWAQVLVNVDAAIDTDGDGMPDSFEIAHGLDPLDPADGNADPDGDGLKNREEFALGTDPRDRDTDGDGLSDQSEALVQHTDPNTADSDGDGIVDGSEAFSGTDPLNPNERAGAAFTPSFKNSAALSPDGIRAAASVDDHLFVLSTDGRITSYRIDPFNYFLIFRDFENLSADLRDVAVEGKTAYVAAGAAGLHIVDISNPVVLARTSTIGGLGAVSGVVVRKGVVFLATDTGLRILRPGAGGSLVNAGSLIVPAFSRLAVTAGTAFLGVPGINRLVAVDISDLSAPRELQRVAMPASTAPFRAVEASGTNVFVAHGSAGVVVVSALNPSSLQIIDGSTPEFPAGNFDALSLLGNHLAAHTATVNTRAQIYRVRDDGHIDLIQDVQINGNGASQLISSQNYLVSLTAGAFAVSEILGSGDRSGVAPTGQLILENGTDRFVPGQEVSVRIPAKDDVYIEGVDFYVNGKLLLHDNVPPFRFKLKIDPTAPPPYEIVLAAVGTDLQRTEGSLGSVLLSVEEDLDGDGTPDSLDADRDGDGVPDLEEAFPGKDGYISDPDLTDTDGDGMDDGEEFLPGLDGFITNPGSVDTDGDGLSDPYEINVTRTHPAKADSDGNGVPDGEEDPDQDGLVNREEAALGSNPLKSDTDGDGLPDGIERELGLDPTRVDTDGDGLQDGDEDFDGDGLKNRQEIARGTDPRAADTDLDGFDDPTEIDLGTDPVTRTDFSSRAVAFNAKTVTLRGPITVGSLALTGSTLTVPAASGRSFTPLDITVSGILSIDGPSKIDVSGKGYPGGRSSGNSSHLGLGPSDPAVSSVDPMTGGSHGGLGGYEDDVSGVNVEPAHGSFQRPASPGSGGSSEPSSSTRGGNGGGAVTLRAGTLVLDGAILSNGEGAPLIVGAGGGAGGSVRIECGVLRGSGSLHADGGSASRAAGRHPGAGGGGRVGVICASAPGFDFTRVTARGGGLLPAPDVPESTGGAGTVFLKIGPGALGELLVENGGRAASEPRTILAGAGEGTVANLGDDFLVRLEGDFPQDIVGLEVDPDTEDGELETFEVLAVDGDRITTAPGLLQHSRPGAGFRGVFRLDRLTAGAQAAVAVDATLALVSSTEPLRLSGGGGVEAPEILLLQGESLQLTDASLAVGRLQGSGGALSSITLTRSRLTFGKPLEAGVLTLETSVLVQGAPLSVGRMDLRGSTVTVPEPTVESFHALDLTVDNALSIDAASKIDAAGKGFVGGYAGGNDLPAGQGAGGQFSGDPRGGGSHGGMGGLPDQGAAQVASVSGSFELPDLPGGGGAAEVQTSPAQFLGGNGGGLIRILAGTLVLDGSIDASGAGVEHPDLFDTQHAGAGAGGSVRIGVGVLRGAGSILAAGGSARAAAGAHGGAGGGGRIALVYGDRSAFTGTLRAPGGAVVPGPAPTPAIGGAGTVFTRLSTSPKGELAVDAENLLPRDYLTVLLEEGEGLVELLRLVVRGGARLDSRRAIQIEQLDAGNPSHFTLRGGLRAVRLELPAVPFLDLQGAELDVKDISSASPGISLVTLNASKVLFQSPFRASSVSLTQGSVITVPDSTSAQSVTLDLDLGSLSIEAGSSVDLAGKGYVGGGRGGNTSRMGETVDYTLVAVGGRTGGAHAALGGFQSTGTGLGTAVAPVYDDFKSPRRPGGGGSAKLDLAELGYNGGGLARVRAQSVLLNGQITVEGDGKQRAGNSDLGGGGGGGGLLLDVQTLSGTGEISADGGAADGNAGAGCGGGGRIAIYYQDKSGFAGAVHAYGGTLIPSVAKTTSVGGAGTIFWKGSSQGYGDLIIDNANRIQSATRTQLRPVGSGTISALSPTSLVSAAAAFSTSDTKLEGQWVVVGNATLTPFLIVTNATTALTTDPASGNMTSAGGPGSTFQGAIVLDNLLVTRRGALTTRGDLIIIATGAVTISDGGSLTSPPIVHW